MSSRVVTEPQIAGDARTRSGVRRDEMGIAVEEFMSRRRDAIKPAAAAGVVAATSVQTTEDTSIGAKAPVNARHAVRRSGVRIKSVIRCEDTVLRYGGVGDNLHMSWTQDDRQAVSLCDGFGWLRRPKGMYNSRLLSITGGPSDAIFQDVPGYPELMPPHTENVPRYYSLGTLAIDNNIYQFLSTPNHPFFKSDVTIWPDARFVGAKVIYSSDNGRTWCNQDGSTPVVWEGWDQRSRDSLVFFEEDQDAFSLLTVLQMGRNYQHNSDGYIYIYAPNGNTEGTMNELVMFRVSKAQILHRDAYEYFAGMQADGRAKWSKDIKARKPVHTFPRGWVNTLVHPYAWQPSVVYNAPLDLYMMANWGMGNAADGMWFGKPSYLGFWTAPDPWGPWTQIHEEKEWTPANDVAARAYQPQIAPKWIGADGKSFWLVWSDYQEKGGPALHKFFKKFVDKQKRHQVTLDDWAVYAAMVRKHQPHYAFNVQRVDLVVE